MASLFCASSLSFSLLSLCMALIWSQAEHFSHLHVHHCMCEMLFSTELFPCISIIQCICEILKLISSNCKTYESKHIPRLALRIPIMHPALLFPWLIISCFLISLLRAHWLMDSTGKPGTMTAMYHLMSWATSSMRTSCWVCHVFVS